MIQTIVEHTDKLGKEFYFSTVSIDGQLLTLSSPNSYCKSLNKAIHLKQLEQVDLNEQDLISIRFFYEEEEYYFVDYGNSIVAYIKCHLMLYERD